LDEDGKWITLKAVTGDLAHVAVQRKHKLIINKEYNAFQIEEAIMFIALGKQVVN